MPTRFFNPLSPAQLPGFRADWCKINGLFTAYLEARYYSGFTIRKDRWRLGQIARWLALRGRNLRGLERGQVRDLIRRYLPDCAPGTARCYIQSLGRWLKFEGRCDLPATRAPWQPWLEQYRHFLLNDRGLSSGTAEGNLRDVGMYLRWQFASGQARWRAVTVDHIWRYCQHCADGRKPITANGHLFAIRRFLRFVHMRGACAAGLGDAVQHVADFGQPTHHKPILPNRKRFLAAFHRQQPSGSRDYAMALLMLDMGLRSCEVARLRFEDVDHTGYRLKLPGVKAGREREIPIPAHAAAALRHYIERFRPDSRSDRVFVRYHDLVGSPLSPLAVQEAMTRAYRRCGFPAKISGAHLLRHSFATRLFARGVTIKGIADLLGHRRLHSSNLYTHVAPSALRRLVMPWPI